MAGMFGSLTPKVSQYRFYGGGEAPYYGPSPSGGVARLQPNYGRRWNEKTQAFDSPEMKSQGWLGPLQNGLGQSVSEYSISQNVNGRNVEMPSIVPGLTPDELQMIMRASETGSQLPSSVYEKAMAHAQERIRHGRSPFWNAGD